MSPTTEAESRRGPLVPSPDEVGARIPISIGWTIVTLVAVLDGSVALGLWLAATAAVAGAQAARSWRHDPDGRRAVMPAAAAGAAAIVLGAGFGVVGLAAGLVLGIAAAVAWARVAGGELRLTLVCAAVPALAAVGPVALRADNGIVPALVLIVYATVYDAANYLIGTGARFRWEGPLAGIACIGTVTLAVAAIFPQFKGSSPWELGAVAAVITPLGPAVASLVLASRQAPVPALRRLDSLALLGPVWAVAAALLVS